MMDANEMGCSVFSGVLKDNLNVIRILSKNKTETDFSHVDIEAQNITILKTSKNCRYFCTYTENENLTIW
jgi:hypothetical protein